MIIHKMLARLAGQASQAVTVVLEPQKIKTHCFKKYMKMYCDERHVQSCGIAFALKKRTETHNDVVDFYQLLLNVF